MTIAETILRRALRGSRFEGHKFRRQVPVGDYVGDFLCVEAKLIVELDGAPHDAPERKVHDERRTIWLRSQDHRVLRIPNDTVIDGCDIAFELIRNVLAEKQWHSFKD